MNTSDTVISTAIGAGSISATASKLCDGQYLKLEENHVICNKRLTLSFRKDCFADGDVIRVGHGEERYCSSYLELTATDIKIYEYTTGACLLAERAHGLTLKDFVSVTIEVGYSSASVTIASASGVYESGIIERCWSGRNGEIFAVSKFSEINDVCLRWYCTDFDKDVWLFGDSYFNPSSKLRWTYYLIQNGYTQFLLSGYPGRASAAAIKDFKQLIHHGQPKYAVWCLGMNDEDGDGISASYLAAVTEFLAICKERSITPILATIPCVPERNHSFKNEWVKASGHRYIDFALAVGGEQVGSAWYEGMLYSDMVHPDELGAKALYARAITDFPEITKRL